MEFSQREENNNFSVSKFESMLKTNSVHFFDSNEFEHIINHYLEIGKINLAKKAVKIGLNQHPTSTNLKLYKVEILIFENKLSKADTILTELYALEPKNEEIYIQKANIFSKSDEHYKAIDTLKLAIDLSGNNEVSDLYALIGMEYLFLDQFDNARIYFSKCLELDPTDYTSLYNIIYCYDFIDDNIGAINFLNKYLDANPYCEVAWHQLGKQYFSIKAYKKSLASFDFAIISDDTFIGAYIEKGKVLEKLGRYNEAIENYNITLSLDDPTSFALLRIGVCYEKMEEKELALKFYYQTVHEDPLLDKGWIAITKFYNKNRNYRKALYYIKKAIGIDKDNVVYWKLYAQINKRLNFLEEAERGYKRTLELGNYELDTWISRADILIELGEYEAAIINLDQASEFYPENEEIEYRLSGCYFSISQSDKAIYHLKNAKKLNKDYHFILNELFPKIANRKLIQNILAF